MPEGNRMAKHTGIRKLSNGRFRARYFQGYDAKTGKRVYPAKTFDTERDARDWRAAQVAGRAPGFVEGRGVPLSNYLDHWLSTKLDIRENSRNTYQTYIDIYIRPALGHIRLSRLSAAHVEQWQSDLLKTLSPQTVTHVRATLHQALSRAQRSNLVRANVVENTDGPKVKRSKRYPLSVEEAIQVISASEDVSNGLVFHLMIYCGLRPEEALGLQWADLELSSHTRGVLRVNRVVHHLKGSGWRFHRPKTVSSERVIKFPADLATKLLEHRKVQLQQKLRAGSLWKDNDLVFANGIGEPLRRQGLEHHFKKMAEQIGLPKQVSMYSLRHFFVTSSLIAGVDIKTVSREAGHSKVAFTMDVYGHVLDEMHDTSASKREHLLKSRSAK
jgi:integrase